MKKSFARKLKIQHNQDFVKVFSGISDKSSKKIKLDGLTFLFRPNSLNHPRLGIMINKKNVANASSRNRLRRIIRESFRHKQHLIGNFDIICIVYRDYKNRNHLDKKKWQAIIDQNLTAI